MEAVHAKLMGCGLLLLLLHGCTTVAQVTTLSEEPCHQKMRDQLESILAEENEKPDIANLGCEYHDGISDRGAWPSSVWGFVAVRRRL